MTGLGQLTVKAIDKVRLERLYTVQTVDGIALKKPEKQEKYLAIDECKLHNGYKCAAHIIDPKTGHILWFQEGKKKTGSLWLHYHVGLDWMGGVEVAACNMNSDFQEAFEEKRPHIHLYLTISYHQEFQ